MALTLPALTALARILPGRKVLSLGYPDIVARPEDIERLFGFRPSRFTDFGRWHGVDFALPETMEFFGAIGSQLDCVDIVPSRGVERVVDLNHPCALGSFDLVIDAGTTEHCFNVGQALINAASAVAVGGHIFHIPPMTMVNHGFYNFSPTLLYDFYSQNGWTIELLVGMRKGIGFEIPITARFHAPPKCSMFCIARRDSEDAPAYPVQSKYLRNPGLS